MTKNLRIAIVLLLVFQLVIAAGFELAHDEAYYWIYSKNLDWGYFDHPPFVAVIIRFFSFLPHSEFSVRIGFIALQFLSVIILLSLTGYSWMPVLLFFSFPLASFTGLLALPDIPLLFMTACYCFQLKKYLENDSLKNSTTLGINIALLFYAKYHGALLIFFTILGLPRLLLKKSFYIVALIALLIFMPHMLWQYEHDFSTLRYHFFERPRSDFSFKRSLEFIGLQIALAGVFVGPVIWWIVFKYKSQDSFMRVMKITAIGTVLFFLLSTMSKKVEANWTIFLTVPLILLVAKSQILERKIPKSLLIISFILVMGGRFLFLVSPQTIKIKRLGEFHGWKNWANEIKTECSNQPILANTYQIASKLSFYLETKISALNYKSRKNQFDVWKFHQDIPTDEVCYITDGHEFGGVTVYTPEGKKLQLVKSQSMKKLLKLKYEEIGKS